MNSVIDIGDCSETCPAPDRAQKEGNSLCPTSVQTLRSSTAGVRPAGRDPGELYANFADKQLGVIGHLQCAARSVAVRYFADTADYAIGDFVVEAGALYVAIAAVTAGPFDPVEWSALAMMSDIPTPPALDFLPLAGGTLTGPLVLDADPAAPLEAATMQYVDGHLPLTGGTMTGPLEGTNATFNPAAGT